MNQTRRQLDQLLDIALDLPAEDLPEFLETRCPAALRERLTGLLDLSEETGLTQCAPFAGELARDLAEHLNDSGPELAAGEELDAWRVLGKLGEGGMGRVYRVESADGRRGALKIAGSRKERVAERFRLETRILAALDHPGIVRFLDEGTAADGRPYLVMELVEGENVDAYCDERLMSTDERLRLFVELCRAVEGAHDARVVHRDLKPANILVRGDGSVKLLDFGIAKSVDSTVAGSEKAVEALTPDYASPEQFLGRPVTEATDVYQLGVLLYRLLTGELPHCLEGRTPNEVMERVCCDEPRRPSRVFAGTAAWDKEIVERARRRSSSVRGLAGTLSGELDGIVLEALDKEPEKRHASVRELRQAVETHLGSGVAPAELAA